MIPGGRLQSVMNTFNKIYDTITVIIINTWRRYEELQRVSANIELSIELVTIVIVINVELIISMSSTNLFIENI